MTTAFEESGFIATNPYGDVGVQVPAARNNRPVAPRLGAAHQWVCTALYSVSDEAAAQTGAAYAAGVKPNVPITLDHENLLTVAGPLCLKCQQPLTGDNFTEPCPVHVVPVLGLRTA